MKFSTQIGNPSQQRRDSWRPVPPGLLGSRRSRLPGQQPAADPGSGWELDPVLRDGPEEGPNSTSKSKIQHAQVCTQSASFDDSIFRIQGKFVPSDRCGSAQASTSVSVRTP